MQKKTGLGLLLKSNNKLISKNKGANTMKKAYQKLKKEMASMKLRDLCQTNWSNTLCQTSDKAVEERTVKKYEKLLTEETDRLIREGVLIIKNC